ncbi:MAG: hypothetical protein IJ825_09935 [Oscillospiraceae bacterium]|nr:hypothetical protein [Oscillospiraceae bacterium]
MSSKKANKTPKAAAVQKPDKTPETQKTQSKLHRLMVQICMLGIAVLVLEIFLFNAGSFGAQKISKDLVLTNYSGAAERIGDELSIIGNASITLEDIPLGAGALVLDIEQGDAEVRLPFQLTMSMTDDNFSATQQNIRKIWTNAPGGKCVLSFQPYGQVRRLVLNFSSVDIPLTLHGIRVTGQVPFHFSILRFLLLFVIGSAVLAIRMYSLHRIRYDRHKTAHRIAVQVMAVVCASSMLLLTRPADKPADYDPHLDYIWDPYAATFKAFDLGQVYLDIPPDAKLAELENVYDKDQRDASDAYYHWDYAYYDGHYYCYFGAAPVVAFYMPFYALSGGKMPPLSMACTFFAVLAALFLCEMLLAAVHLTVPRPNLLLLMGCMAGAVCVSGIGYEANTALRYNLPVLSGMCFLFLGLWLGFTALTRPQGVGRCLLLTGSGAALAFCAGSRPDLAMASLVLAPFFIGILLNKRMTIRSRIGQAGCFLIPVMAGACVLFAYNKARFGSPFDFGAGYQLTVSNIQANRMSVADLPYMLLHYFFQTPRARDTFPYFEPDFVVRWNYGHYSFSEYAVAVLTYPMIVLGLFLVPFAGRRKNSYALHGVAAWQHNVLLVLGVLLPVVTAWAEFCMGGTAQRYVSDIMPLLILVSVIAILRSAGMRQHSSRGYAGAWTAIFVSMGIVWLLTLGVRDGSLTRTCPYLYDTVRDMVMFWE